MWKLLTYSRWKQLIFFLSKNIFLVIELTKIPYHFWIFPLLTFSIQHPSRLWAPWRWLVPWERHTSRRVPGCTPVRPRWSRASPGWRKLCCRSAPVVCPYSPSVSGPVVLLYPAKKQQQTVYNSPRWSRVSPGWRTLCCRSVPVVCPYSPSVSGPVVLLYPAKKQQQTVYNSPRWPRASPGWRTLCCRSVPVVCPYSPSVSGPVVLLYPTKHIEKLIKGTCSRLGKVAYNVSFYPKLHTSVV